MRLSKGVLYMGLAAALLFAVSAPAKAGTIPVDTDSGSGTATVTGTAAGANIVSNAGALITTVDGAAVSFNLGIAEALIGSGGVITGISGTKKITDAFGDTAQLELKMQTGTYSSTSMTVTATIMGVFVTGPNAPALLEGGNDYLFGTLLGGTTVITATGDFTSVFDTPGSTPLTGVPFTIAETVVPEPSTMALLGIGMTGFFAFRRFFKRHATA
jgi:hypothetical protein